MLLLSFVLEQLQISVSWQLSWMASQLDHLCSAATEIPTSKLEPSLPVPPEDAPSPALGLLFAHSPLSLGVERVDSGTPGSLFTISKA